VYVDDKKKGMRTPCCHFRPARIKYLKKHTPAVFLLFMCHIFKDKRAFGAGAASGWPRHRNKSGRLDPNAAVVMSPPDACYAKYIPLSSVTNPNRLFASSPSPGGAGGVPLPLSKTLDLLFPEGVTGAEAPPRQRLTIWGCEERIRRAGDACQLKGATWAEKERPDRGGCGCAATQPPPGSSS
jgi:hypothetical protein